MKIRNFNQNPNIELSNVNTETELTTPFHKKIKDVYHIDVKAEGGKEEFEKLTKDGMLIQLKQLEALLILNQGDEYLAQNYEFLEDKYNSMFEKKYGRYKGQIKSLDKNLAHKEIGIHHEEPSEYEKAA